MKVTVQLFASLREAVGCSHLQVELEEKSTVEGLVQTVRELHPRLSGHLDACRVAVDREFAPLDAPLSSDSEVALIPLVSGGKSGCER